MIQFTPYADPIHPPSTTPCFAKELLQCKASLHGARNPDRKKKDGKEVMFSTCKIFEKGGKRCGIRHKEKCVTHDIESYPGCRYLRYYVVGVSKQEMDIPGVCKKECEKRVCKKGPCGKISSSMSRNMDRARQNRTGHMGARSCPELRHRSEGDARDYLNRRFCCRYRGSTDGQQPRG
jgi:hypothetical protein